MVGKVIISTQKDKEDLLGKTLDEKFNVIVNSINNEAFEGEGNITYVDKNHFNLYRETSNQIVEFLYSQGMLSITWKYKYFQKEMVYRRNLNGVRNLSLFEQNKIARAIIEEVNYKIQIHKNNVMTIFNE
ncbi:MAG: hypothetical protein ACTIJT_12505 [Mesonia sp.]|uniref:hypothetical protein n=1 Tax=Mesonia sp. TaxID=1960830 RepID=UPI003F9A20D3